MDLQTLKTIIARAPRNPGIYRFAGTRGVNLYIGKASNVRSRLLSYLKTADVRLRTMIAQARSVSWEETGSDIEALILESQLIKQYRPRFNIVMRDDKQYFYVGFTNEDFPKIFVTHQPTKASSFQLSGNRGSSGKLKANSYNLATDFLGPFTEGAPLKTALRRLRRLFPYCTCTQKHHVRCLNAHIGMCLGFCCLKQQNPETRDMRQATKEYRRNIGIIRDILTGKRTRLVNALDHGAIRRVFQNARINARAAHKGAPARVEGYDIANIQGQHAAGAMVVFSQGAPDKSQYRLFTIRTVAGSDDTAMLREVLERRFKHPEWPAPDLVIVDGGKAQVNAALAATSNRRIDVIGLVKNERHRGDHVIRKTPKGFVATPLAELPAHTRNLVLAVDAEAHRFAVQHYRKLHRRRLKS